MSADGDLYVYNANQVQLASSTLTGSASETINVDLPANQWALAAVRPDLDIHDADYHGGFGTFGMKKPAAK